MKRPFVTLCIFLFIGIVSSYFLSYSIPIHYVLYSAVISFIILLLYERGFEVCLFLTVLILGGYLYGHSVAGDTLLEAAPNNISMNARILKQGTIRKGYSEYEVYVLNLFSEESRKVVKVNKNAQLKIYKSYAVESDLIENDMIEIRDSRIIKLLENINDIKANSYELYLKSKGIEYILEANSENIVRINEMGFNSLELSHMNYKTKVYIEDFLDSTLEFENSDILKSIVFGNQGYLSKDKLSVFSKTGTAHIMAVSGLHVGLIVLIIDRLLKFIRINRNGRLCITVVILIFYAYMVYFPVSIIRAGAMYILYVIAYFLHRRYDSLNALFLIAFIMLVYRPMSVFSISFQLSFVATFSILLLSPIITKVLNKRIGVLGTLLAVTLSAQIGTMPIMAYHFKQISVISLVTNLLIIPLLLPMLSLAFISIVVGIISFRIGFLINHITNHLLNYINWISEKCAIIPYGSFEVSEVKIIHIIVYYLLIAFVYYGYKQIEGKRISNSNEEGLVKMYEL